MRFRAVLLLMGLAAWANIGIAATSVDIAPRPDVVVVYERPAYGKRQREVWYRHGDLIRIDIDPTTTSGRPLRESQFTRAGQKVKFTASYFEDGRVAMVKLTDFRLDSLPSMELRTFTGKIETHLGEECRVWTATRRFAANNFVEHGCVTADGIELWHRHGDEISGRGDIGTALYAREIRREAVAPDKVRPPLELLDITQWMPEPRSANSGADYQNELVSETSKRIAMRSGDWFSTSEQIRDHRQFRLWNPEARIVLEYSEGSSRELTISRELRDRPEFVSKSRARVTDRPDEMILGENCQWWGMTDYTHGNLECLTQDGISLKIEPSGWSGSKQKGYSSVRLERAPVPLSTLMPPKEILSPEFWGF